MELKINPKILKLVGCRPAVMYEYIRFKNFQDRGWSKITYDEFMGLFGTKADKPITRGLRKLQEAGLIKKRGINEYKAVEF